jgi:hypothetical protein
MLQGNNKETVMMLESNGYDVRDSSPSVSRPSRPAPKVILLSNDGSILQSKSYYAKK